VDGRYFGTLSKDDLAGTKSDFEATAQIALANSDADHVVYCFIEYDSNGEVMVARFYSGLKMDDDQFYETTGGLVGDHYVGAVHRLK
jgi:hypothetical protein